MIAFVLLFAISKWFEPQGKKKEVEEKEKKKEKTF